MIFKGRGAAPLMLLLACQTQRSSESQSSYAQKVVDDGSWGMELMFAPPAQSPNDTERRQGQPEGGARHVPYIPTPGSVTSSVAPAAPATGHPLIFRFDPLHPEAFLEGLPEHGLLLGVKLTGQLPKSTSVQASGSAEAESKSRPFGIFALLAAGWPFLLGACGVAALYFLKPPWLIAGWSILKSIFRRSN